MNTEQESVVLAPDRWQIVLAGPGSGKSTVIVARAKHLVSEDVNPADMAFVTFTSIGAKVLRRRLAEAIGPVGFVGTLHAMMLGLLRRADPRWVLIGEDDSDEFLQRHAKLMGYRGTAAELAAARALDETTDRMTPALRAVRSYRDFMRSERMLDFDMVLTEGHALIRAASFRTPWSHWFVDEFQDSGSVDAKIYLAAKPDYLLVVGDPDQSIFAFRGARPANVADYWNSGAFARHGMSLNYRCAPPICDAANAVISRNADRIEKMTVPTTDPDSSVTTDACGTDAAERERVTTYVGMWIEAGIAPHDIAVICRTNRLAYEMRDAISMAVIPVAEVESERKPKDWPLLMLILSQIATPTSWATARLLARAIAKAKKEDPVAAEESVTKARQAGGTPASYWALPSLAVVMSLNADFSRYGVGKAAHALLASRIRIYRPETAEDLLSCLRESPEAKATRGVNCLTVHAAKGEEWSAVIVPGAELFRSEDDAGMEEERRLAFVAITRAKRYLVMTCASSRRVALPTGQTVTVNRPAGEVFDTVAASVRHLVEAQ